MGHCLLERLRLLIWLLELVRVFEPFALWDLVEPFIVEPFALYWKLLEVGTLVDFFVGNA